MHCNQHNSNESERLWRYTIMNGFFITLGELRQFFKGGLRHGISNLVLLIFIAIVCTGPSISPAGKRNIKPLGELKDSGHPLDLDSAHSDIVNVVKFSDDGGKILTGSDDLTMKLWIIPSHPNDPIIRDRTFDVGLPVKSVDFHPNGDKVLAVGLGPKSHVSWWNTSGERLYRTSNICEAIFLRKPDWVRCYSLMNHKIENWEVSADKPRVGEPRWNELTLSKGFNSPNARFSWDGMKLLVFRKGAHSHEADLYTARDGIHRFSFDVALDHHHAAKINDADLTDGGNLIVTCDDNYHVYLWERESESLWLWRRDYRKPGCHNEAVQAVAISPQRDRVLTGGKDAKVILWDRATGDDLEILDSFDSDVNDVAFSPDGRKFIVAAGKRCYLYEIIPAASPPEPARTP